MSQFFNTIEPQIIDDEMLQKAIEEKCPEDLGDIAREESLNVKVVTELQFSFKNILRVDNLWPLENLTKLQLDNNVIEKIEGLESLVHLVWLDLSFNNIEVIEGLDTLVKLQDLSLYSNRISKIEHMDTLQELQIFSIGKNNLTTLEDVIYLRRLKSLQTLNLSGNPFCSEEHYRLFVVAHLPSLVYLDFKLVRNSTREAAALKYQDLTKPLEQEEAQVLALQEAEDAKQKKLEYDQAAFVEYLNGSFLFDSLHAEDREAAKLASLPGVGDLLQAYKKEFVLVCGNLYNYGLEEYEKREAEVSKFYKRLHEIMAVNQQESKRIISDFESQNQKRLDELSQAGSGEVAESKQAQGKEGINQLLDALLTLEALVSNDLEELLQDFKRSIDVLASTFTENIQGMFNQCRDLENQHHKKLMEIAMATLRKVEHYELEEDFPADLRRLFKDKNTIVNILNVSHSIRLRKIDKRESDMLCNIYQWQISVTGKAFQTESDRNRACIKKIICFINTLQKELESTMIPEPTE
uniref:Dynein regulatory complex subunit 3 n=1 Tax=Taeniopygia guttata TaxID=59729 RepID=H0ZAA7_TAEGU|nr:dynein regulatory complex subunit 3 isoform X1 [Taeniopygia guttata]XP_030140979.3 dynein regulatory complex subunit 3 isoform X1 [Taeniopygia guttata]XP_030140980.3 dynein regulatory complex subunit 3 isoform X1 [Taeniopygia guttata]XP_041575001.1 dynein regulatory complex subunit 3 isoform X1 [Taeniopygia guttata]